MHCLPGFLIWLTSDHSLVTKRFESSMLAPGAAQTAPNHLADSCSGDHTGGSAKELEQNIFDYMLTTS